MTEQKKKLLVLSSTYPRWKDDWEPAFVHELSKRLTDEFDVTVLCPREKDSKRKEIREGVNIHRYRYAPNHLSTLVSNGGITSNIKANRLKWLLVSLFLPAQIIATWSTIRRLNPDAIHCHWIIPQGICLIIARLLLRKKPPILLTSHGGDLYTFNGKIGRRIKKYVLINADAITVVSEAMREEADQISGRELEISVIPMGVDTENLFYPDPTIDRSKSEILFVGRLVEKKGAKYLIDAFKIVLDSIPESTLTIVGDGPERQALERQAIELKIDNRVTFEGSILNKELPHFYRRATVFVAPFITASNGDQEGLGLVLAEAISCGCKVISAHTKPAHQLQKILTNPRQLLTFNQKSTQELAMKIIKNLTTSEQSYLKANHENISQAFSYKNISSRYIEMLKPLIR
ncbi:glycosyltransferase [Spongiibacter nanhainus]|uniref:Glycosyltransferase n=1 Tax=Spongiibacter nanhainus TaxID=2794344 RepID=A0A7T4R2M9_9GAMM|nr:glycosyltransferase [Spongiibacter nanhainus]QQD19092.1 glycosyltransferase [Spongiibacter nanhainus]